MNLIYKEWLNSSFVSDETKEKMKKMSIKDIDNAFPSKPLKFGTAGCRAIVGPGTIFLNEHTYKQLAIGYAKLIIKKAKEKNIKPNNITIIVGHDNRENGDCFSFQIAEILTHFGINVKLFYNNLPTLTPLVSYVIRKTKAQGGINITASHNPKEYNGFKAYDETGTQLCDEDCKMLCEIMPNIAETLHNKIKPNKRKISYVSDFVVDSYLNDIKKNLIKTKKLKRNNDPIIYTALNGAGSLYIQNFLTKLGYNIIPVLKQCFIDGNFSNSPLPNPENQNSFKQSIKTAKKFNSEILISVDPDGDRFAFAIKQNNKWHFFNGNETGILLTNYILEYKKELKNRVPIIISTYVSNNLINRIAKQHNAIVLRTATGFKNIGKAMNNIDNENAMFCIGFEEAVGSCVNFSIREKDGVSTAALILEMYNFYKEKNMTLLDVLNKRIYNKYGYWYGETISINIEGNNWKAIAERIEDKILDLKINKICKRNIKNIFWNEPGSCIEFDLGNDSWIKFRISGTEPKFKIYFNLYTTTKNNIPPKYQIQKLEVINLTNKIKKILGL